MLLVADPEDVLSLEHVEQLVLVAVHVRRGVQRIDLLDDPQRAAGGLRRRADHELGAAEPQPLAVVRSGRHDGQPIATMRSIGSRARSAISAGTLTSTFISRSESRTFGSVIIFMYLQKAIRLASIRFACGAAWWSG